MTDPPATHNGLLFAILSYQLGFISQDQLFGIVRGWLGDKSTSLAELLVAKGIIDVAERDLIDQLVQAHQDRNNVDPDGSMMILPLSTVVRQGLSSLQDPDVDRTLSEVSIDAHQSASHLRWVGDPDRFQILRPHAKGGLGQVHVALDKQLGRKVALKEMQFRYAEDQISCNRFIQEAEVTGRLEHPGIVPIYAAGMYSDGRPYYAMRFIGGVSLKRAIAEHHDGSSGHNTPERLRGLLRRFADVCNAVEYAHSRGIIHRDLKPSNIMLGKFGETLLVDWGLAKSFAVVEAEESSGTTPFTTPASGSTDTLLGSTVGTPAYMSPEQADGRALVGPSSDIFNLGATLYCILTGRAPYAGTNADEILKKARQCEFETPRKIRDGISRPLEAICMKAMATNVADRYMSAAQLASDVESWVADEPVIARPEGRMTAFARWVRKHRLATSAIAIGMLLVTIVSVASTIRISESLRRSYVSEALSLQAARSPGYGPQVKELIRRAVPAKTNDDLAKLRDTLVATLGDFVSEEPIFVTVEFPTYIAFTPNQCLPSTTAYSTGCSWSPGPVKNPRSGSSENAM